MTAFTRIPVGRRDVYAVAPSTPPPALSRQDLTTPAVLAVVVVGPDKLTKLLGQAAFAGRDPRHPPGLWSWAAKVADGGDAGVQLSLHGGRGSRSPGRRKPSNRTTPGDLHKRPLRLRRNWDATVWREA
ncbi:hypothetical protein AB0O67_25420 [Streptomyces sp. NPDC086077]|uniref:hypothetical protein n=1 Tax=Streptomyces sp. NPDC086077 TaxID=3154862 RepID=UPI003449C57E